MYNDYSQFNFRPFNQFSITNVAYQSLNKLPDRYGTVAELMSLSAKEWSERGTSMLNKKMAEYCQQCVPDGKGMFMQGFFEKHDQQLDSDVAVIGDIHGSMERLDITLKALQQRGYLDKDFRCLPGKHILFIGDYVDRGSNNLEVLEKVISFKLENKEQVTLLRGNHEDLTTNMYSSRNDKKYSEYLREGSNQDCLSSFYRSLPLTVYLGVNPGDKTPQYMQFSHALFHAYTDPAPLFSSGKRDDYLWVEGRNKFSKRIKGLRKSMKTPDESKYQTKQREAALKLDKLTEKYSVKFDDIYWLDVGDTIEENEITGRVSLDPQSIKAYLTACGSDAAKIKELTRGHQNSILIHKYDGKIIATTLDPSRFADEQTYMELKLSEKVRDWKRSFVKIPLLNDHLAALEKVTVVDCSFKKEEPLRG